MKRDEELSDVEGEEEGEERVWSLLPPFLPSSSFLALIQLALDDVENEPLRCKKIGKSCFVRSKAGKISK
jgi:hypothetical protein